MAYSVPTVADFKARYPAFATVSDATVGAFLAEGIEKVGVTWIDSDRRSAQMVYTAHLLTLEGLGESKEAQLAGFKSLSVGSLSLSRGEVSADAYGTLGSTSYGQRFIELRRLSFPGIAVSSNAWAP